MIDNQTQGRNWLAQDQIPQMLYKGPEEVRSAKSKGRVSSENSYCYGS